MSRTVSLYFAFANLWSHESGSSSPNQYRNRTQTQAILHMALIAAKYNTKKDTKSHCPYKVTKERLPWHCCEVINTHLEPHYLIQKQKTQKKKSLTQTETNPRHRTRVVPDPEA